MTHPLTELDRETLTRILTLLANTVEDAKMVWDTKDAQATRANLTILEEILERATDVMAAIDENSE